MAKDGVSHQSDSMGESEGEAERYEKGGGKGVFDFYRHLNFHQQGDESAFHAISISVRGAGCQSLTRPLKYLPVARTQEFRV